MLFGAGKKQLTALHRSRNGFAFDLGRVELPEAMDVLEIDGNMIYGSIPRLPPAAAARKWLAFNVSDNQLCGPIPQGRYTHRFGPIHFAGNKCLSAAARSRGAPASKICMGAGRPPCVHARL